MCALWPGVCAVSVFSAQVTGKYLYSSRKRQTKVDLLKTPYMCFALRGNAKNFLRIKVNYQDTYNRSKNIGLTLEHSARFARDKWSYQCLNLQEMAMNSRLKRFIKKGSWIKLFEVEVPEQEAVHETLYVDEVAFVSEPLYVEAERPSVLESLGILVSEVRVTRGEGNRRAFNLTLQSANCAGKYPLLGLVSDSLNATWMEELRTASRASFSIAGGEAEVERIQETNQDVIGSWELAIGGTTIKGLSPSVSASELQTVIERSLGVAGVQVRSGDEQESCGERKWHLEWVALPGRQELLVPSASNLLVGGAVNIRATREEAGSIVHSRVSSQFFSVRRTQPHVSLTVRGYRAVCLGKCSFTYTDTSTPRLTSLSATRDADGFHILSIQGDGFSDPNPQNYSVTVGGRPCAVASVQLEEKAKFKKPSPHRSRAGWRPFPAGSHPVSLSMQPAGYAHQPTPPLVYEAPVTLASVTPSRGGVGGGYDLVIRGDGLPSTSQGGGQRRVRGGRPLPSHGRGPWLRGVRGAAWGAGKADVIVAIEGVATTMKGAFSGSASVTYNLKVSGFSPRRGSVNGGTTVALRGRGFGDDCSLLKVTLGAAMTCEVMTCSDDLVTCVTKRRRVDHVVNSTGTHYKYGEGYAWAPGSLHIDAGDTVTWSWGREGSRGPISTPLYNVFQTASPAGSTYDGAGFHSGPPSRRGGRRSCPLFGEGGAGVASGHDL
ncbi:putative fibrocystin-L isoform X3 [Penaeus vannamei]|uniref:Putative fibrocystin-L isoform X3 n=1 Tax=Penaeus vannamei TaxID=6689 RepID=A0A3R7P5K0_PENVA|nr:putative fibrocystin-L isoform X3 [Penaeus vannamei]